LTEGPQDQFVPIAEVVKAVGLQGEMKLYHLLNWHEPLLDSPYLTEESGRAMRVTHHRAASTGTIVGLAGCRGRQDAQGYVGKRLGFQRSRYEEPDFPRPARGLPFRFLLREVALKAGGCLGVVTEVRLYGNQLTLVIPREGREVLIPAVPPILIADDGMTGPLMVDPPEGLLDVFTD
jgi:ribosomal 30S subunit maturation factor RimM